MESFRILLGPDLLSNDEIFRVPMKRLGPNGNRFVLPAGLAEKPSEPEFGLNEFLLGSGELVRTLVGRALTGIIAGQETLDGGDVFRFVDRKAAVLRVADDAGFIDQDTVRDGPEI